MYVLYGTIPHNCHFFYTDRIFENQILHQKKRLKAPKTLKMSLKKSNVCIFFTQSGKIYTDMSVVSVTNLRYVWNIKIGRMKFYCNWILLLLEA